MTAARTTLLAFAVAALLAPEFRQYRADRELRRATAVFRAIVTAPPTAPRRSRALGWVRETALDAAAAIPGDSRGLILAGSAALVGGEGPAALVAYRRALAAGERAEIDLNLARTYALERRQDDAHAALVRAGWVSPVLLRSLPQAAQLSVRRDLKLAVRALRAGKLTTPPALPLDAAGG